MLSEAYCTCARYTESTTRLLRQYAEPYANFFAYLSLKRLLQNVFAVKQLLSVNEISKEIELVI